jgi:hypothetical protein
MVGLVKGHVGGLKVHLRVLFGTRLKAKGGGGTPRLGLMSDGRLCLLLNSDGISLDYNYKQSLYNNYIYVISIRGYSK